MGSAHSPSCEESPVFRSGRHDPYLRVQSVNIFVRNLDRSVRFYVEQLGFDLAFDARITSGRRWVAVAAPDGTASLTLVEAEPDSRESKLIGRPTQVTFVTEDVAAKFREWRGRGVRFSYAPRLKRLNYRVRVTSRDSADPGAPGEQSPPIWGGVFTRFQDIDGNSFALVGFDEVTREIEEQRRAIAEKQEAERRAGQELEIAKQVQARLFPQTLPVLETLEYAGTCVQARQVGGDYYDFLDLGRNRLGLVVGDISGKGIAAALLMANLQANLRTQCAIASDQPQRFLQCVNQLFYANTADTAFATLFFAEYTDATRRLRYANCGHLPALLLRSDGTLEQLDSTSTVLGLFEAWDCAMEERSVRPGDTLVIYTDGVTESFNEAGEEFGEERLIEALRHHHRESSAQALLASLIQEVHRFSYREQHDDVTLVVARCGGK